MKSRELLLWSGCALGLVLALYGARNMASSPAPQSTNSGDLSVNGTSLSGLALKDASTDEINRLIDEELLIQKALKLGVLRKTPQVRQHLLIAMGEYVAASSPQPLPDEATLRDYFEKHIRRFMGPRSFKIKCIFFRGNTAESRGKIEGALQSLKDGKSFDDAKTLYGSKPSLPVPSSALPPGALRMYLGPTAAKIVESLEPNTSSRPIRVAGGSRIVKLIGVVEPPTPLFKDYKEKVMDQYAVVRRGQLMKSYIAALRAGAKIQNGPVESPVSPSP